MASAKQMQMQMEHALPCSAAIVQNRAITFEKVALARKLCGDKLDASQNLSVLGRSLVERHKMFARANQNVRGRLRMNVFKRENFRIFVNHLGRNLFLTDLAEQAVFAQRLPPDPGASSRRTTNGTNPSLPRNCSPNWRAASSPE